MGDTKQGLNGAYYGPAVPPRQAARSIGRGSSCCCGPCCLLCTLFKFLLSIIITLGIIVLVLWLVFRPNEGKVYVEKAALSQFSLTNGTLAYNLSMDISIRNPNRRISLYYDYIEAVAYYDDSRFGFTTLPTFYQGHKNTSMLYPVFKGQQVVLGNSATTFNRENTEGFFYVKVDINTKVRYKVWFIKSNKYKPHAECKLKLPAPGSSAVFEKTKCDVDLF
ncbi:unnamed protein product [Spirodela intermedia]|uniref:Late embryogenesis abundant protein LEA-2 subgroup domain-containing protein n=1 Tax=Spirodela intermedia TaxID=51605 RepID=A0A7I8KGN8_SPIIN|nr:unnamed protein product [Spirodela intermedia]